MVHHSIRPSGRLFEWCDVRLPARRRVACASRETAQVGACAPLMSTMPGLAGTCSRSMSKTRASLQDASLLAADLDQYRVDPHVTEKVACTQALNAKLTRALAVRAAGEVAGGAGFGAGGERMSADGAPPHSASDLHIMHRSAPKDHEEEDELAAQGTPPRSGTAGGGDAAQAGGTNFADAIVGSGGLLPSSETVGLKPSSPARNNDTTAAGAGSAAPTQHQQQPQPQQRHASPIPDTSTQRLTRQAEIIPAPDTGSATVAIAAAALQLQPALRTLLLLCDCAGSSERQMAYTLMSIKMLADATSMSESEHHLQIPTKPHLRCTPLSDNCRQFTELP